MRFQRADGRLIVRVEAGEEAIETLTRLCRDERVAFASLSAAGAAKRLRLGFWNAETQAYEHHDIEDQLEVVSFQGNVAIKDGEPFLHLHGVFARSDLTTLGGHIVEAWIHPTLEVWIRVEDVPVHRSSDPASGLDLLDLPEA